MSHASFVHKFISSQKHSVIQSKWFIRYWKWAGQEDTRKFHFYVVHTPRISTPITILHSFKWLMVFWENFLGVSKYFEFSSVVVSRQNVFYGVLTIFKSDPKLWRREIYWIEPQWLHLSHFACGSSSTFTCGYYLWIKFYIDSLTATEGFSGYSRRRLENWQQGSNSKSMWLNLWTPEWTQNLKIFISPASTKKKKII